MNYRYSSSVPVQVQVVVSGFTLPSPSPSLSSNSSRSKKKTFTTKLQMSSRNNSNNNSFDLSKPTFDLFSLRTIRNDALLQYSSLNQSEPLRINLYLILTVTLFSFPTLSEAVIGEEANLYSTLLSTVGGIGSFGLFLKECNSRLNQLKRIEKEMNAEFLELKLSTENKLNPVLFDGGSRSVTTLSSLRGKKRIVALTGTTKELKECMKDFRVFRRRINQANSIVIPVPTDLEGTDLKEWWKALNIKETEIRSCQWIGQPQDISAWKEYFKNLVIDNKTDDKSRDGADGIVWFGLNYNGRSFASGLESPMLLQILGQNLRPADFLDETDEAEVINAANKEVDAEVLNNIKYCQARFYEALTKGDLEEMNSICSHKNAQEVTEVSLIDIPIFFEVSFPENLINNILLFFYRFSILEGESIIGKVAWLKVQGHLT